MLGFTFFLFLLIKKNFTMFQNISFSINILFFVLIIWLFILYLGKKNKFNIITEEDIKILKEVVKLSKTKEELSNKIYELIQNEKIFFNNKIL